MRGGYSLPVAVGLNEGGPGCLSIVVACLLLASPFILYNTIDPHQRFTALVVVGVIATVLLLELARLLSPEHPLWKLWAIVATFRRTAFETLGVGVVWGVAICAVVAIPLGLVFLVIRQPAVSWTIAIATGTGVAALVVGAYSASKYLFAGQRYIVKELGKHTPTDEETLSSTSGSVLRFYHALLCFAGAVNFACLCVLQIVAFGLVTWSVGEVFPSVLLFENQDQLNISSAILFWAEELFALVDGPRVFGLTLSLLDPVTATWPFGVAIVFYKLFVVGLTLRLFQTTMNLRPRDISNAWADAIERKTS